MLAHSLEVFYWQQALLGGIPVKISDWELFEISSSQVQWDAP